NCLPAVSPGSEPVRTYRRLRALRSEEHTAELQSPDHLVCRLLREKKNIGDRRLGILLTRRLDAVRRGLLLEHVQIFAGPKVETEPLFFRQASVAHQDLHSFPTRPSSD